MLEQDKINKWRKEFDNLNKNQSSATVSFELLKDKYGEFGDYKDFSTQVFWLGYLARISTENEKDSLIDKQNKLLTEAILIIGEAVHYFTNSLDKEWAKEWIEGTKGV